MFPDLWTQQTANGPVTFHTYGLFLMLAFAAAAFVLSRRMKRVGIDPDHMLPIVAIAIVGGILGARLLHFVGAEPDAFFANPLIFFDVGQGGMAFYGGAIFAGLGIVTYLALKRLPLLKMADVAAPSLLLGLSIGRLGCLAAGCCHGMACDAGTTAHLLGDFFPGGDLVLVDGFPWLATEYKAGVGVGSIHGRPTFPTPLWESLGALALFAALSAMWRWFRRFDGQILALTMLTYPPLRATIETFRGDAIRGTEWFGFLSTSQVVSIPVFAVGLLLVATRMNKGVSPEVAWSVPEDQVLEDDAP